MGPNSQKTFTNKGVFCMEQRPLAGLEPACVFLFFEEICAIPHGSRNTKTISDYLVRFAQERGLRFRQDEVEQCGDLPTGHPGV